MLWQIFKPHPKTIEAECGECGASGIQNGVNGREDYATICPKCGGKGFIQVKYMPFFMRKKKKGISYIVIDSHYLLYQDFLKLKMTNLTLDKLNRILKFLKAEEEETKNNNWLKQILKGNK